jgi:AraC-like DNA-binding protein
MQVLSIVNFTAAIQGIFLSYLLFNRRSESKEYRALAFLVLVMSVGLLGAVLGLSGYYRQLPHLMRIGDPMGLLLGPLLYRYIYLLTKGRPPRPFFLHLIPFVLYVIALIPFYAMSASAKIAFGETIFLNKHQNMQVLIIQVIRFIHVLIYIFLSLQLTKQFDRLLENNFSETEKINLHKSHYLLRLYIVICLSAIGVFIAGFFIPFHFVLANNLVGLGISLMIYSLAYVSWNRPVVQVVQLAPLVSGKDPVSIPLENPAVIIRETDQSPADKGRSTLHLSDEQYQKFSTRLDTLLVDDKVYLENELSLAQLSEKLNVPPYQASELISRQYGESFFDLINRHRIEEVKKRLTDPAFSHLSILGIAMDCGFNSKSSFNTAFKKFTGQTPSQFRIQ